MGKKRGSALAKGGFRHSRDSDSGKIFHKKGQKHSHGHAKHENLLERFGLETKDEIPIGIKVMTFYTLLLALVYLFAAIVSPTAIVFGNLVGGFWGKMANIAYACILLTLAFGFVARRKWVWRFALAWYSYAMIDAIVSGFSINSYFDLLMNLIFSFLLFTFIANALLLWYVYRKRTYFLGRSHPRVSKEDRIFIMLIALIVLFFAVIATLTIAKFFYETSKIAKEVAVEVKTAFPGEELLICKSKDLPDRDICYLTLSIIRKDTLFCRAIVSDLYKMTCYRGELLKSG